MQAFLANSLSAVHTFLRHCWPSFPPFPRNPPSALDRLPPCLSSPLVLPPLSTLSVSPPPRSLQLPSPASSPPPARTLELSLSPSLRFSPSPSIIHAAGRRQGSQKSTAHGTGARDTTSSPPPHHWIPPFDRLWRIRWENVQKETAWQVSIDGIGIAGNTHLTHAPGPVPCGCGVTPTHSPRLHVFWQCAVAQAVVQQLAAQLAAPPTREQVWLWWLWRS